MKRAERPGVRMQFGLGGLAWAEQGVSPANLARNPRDSAVIGTTRLLEGFVEPIARAGSRRRARREARDVLAVIDGAVRVGANGQPDRARAGPGARVNGLRIRGGLAGGRRAGARRRRS